ncbi:hypothetical protein BN1013_01677 [Candidatus Rubidus massiliensis]|nr:hypothetical protein BN1013_01677 [Candidatus Rubidus massiliensis]
MTSRVDSFSRNNNNSYNNQANSQEEQKKPQSAPPIRPNTNTNAKPLSDSQSAPTTIIQAVSGSIFEQLKEISLKEELALKKSDTTDTICETCSLLKETGSVTDSPTQSSDFFRTSSLDISASDSPKNYIMLNKKRSTTPSPPRRSATIENFIQGITDLEQLRKIQTLVEKRIKDIKEGPELNPKTPLKRRVGTYFHLSMEKTATELYFPLLQLNTNLSNKHNLEILTQVLNLGNKKLSRDIPFPEALHKYRAILKTISEYDFKQTKKHPKIIDNFLNFIKKKKNNNDFSDLGTILEDISKHVKQLTDSRLDQEKTLFLNYNRLTWEAILEDFVSLIKKYGDEKLNFNHLSFVSFKANVNHSPKKLSAKEQALLLKSNIYDYLLYCAKLYGKDISHLFLQEKKEGNSSKVIEKLTDILNTQEYKWLSPFILIFNQISRKFLFDRINLAFYRLYNGQIPEAVRWVNTDVIINYNPLKIKMKLLGTLGKEGYQVIAKITLSFDKIIKIENKSIVVKDERKTIDNSRNSHSNSVEDEILTHFNDLLYIMGAINNNLEVYEK